MNAEQYKTYVNRERAKAEDAYFAERPQLLGTHADRALFRAAFERGFSAGQELCDMQIAAALV